MPLFHHPQAFKVAMVAGEASGDLLAAPLIAAIRAVRPDAEFVGIGGPLMQGEGLRSLYPQEDLAVRGYAEVLKSLPRLLSIRRGLKQAFLADPPDVFIGIDAPDFNLGLEKTLKAHGIPTVHYVSPSIWAWRGERIHKIKKAVNRVLALFPMEEAIYQKAGIPVTYVGHPLAPRFHDLPDRAQMRAQLRLPIASPVFTLLPGSRVSEIDYMAPLFLETARRIHAAIPEAVFLVPLATRSSRDRFLKILARSSLGYLPLRPLYGHAPDAVVASEVVLAASGTVTLEVAMAKRPMVISYRVSPLTYRIVRRKLKLPYVGLPNILSGRFVVPELLQDDATAENLCRAVLNIYHDKVYQIWLEQHFTELHQSLCADSATLAARAVLDTAKRREA